MIKQFEIQMHGFVQGYGLRPQLARAARSLHLVGWVRNSRQGLDAAVQGNEKSIQLLVERITRVIKQYDPHFSFAMNERPITENYSVFSIIPSDPTFLSGATPPFDIALCGRCRIEFSDPTNRRYRYPFINCAECGPRISILHTMPYDRANTSMEKYSVCTDCEKEYKAESNSRYFAQTICCERCGPSLSLYDAKRNLINSGNKSWLCAIEFLKAGAVVAVKGIGGFHLMADAKNASAVAKLRHRKHRPDKPFAVLFADSEHVSHHVELSEAEKTAFESLAAPIVLARRKKIAEIAENVAPNNPLLGVMKAYTGLHLLLLQEMQSPLVATSANRSGEPICYTLEKVLAELADVADYVLDFDREIAFPQDDSVLQFIAEKPMLLRRARGFPLAIQCGNENGANQQFFACGPYLKNTVTLADQNQLWLSPHLGDLATEKGRVRRDKMCEKIENLTGYRLNENAVFVYEQHSDSMALLTSGSGKKNKAVQHHLAHACSLLATEKLDFPALIFAWDGVGISPNRTIWGSECFYVEKENSVQHCAQLVPFPLLGGLAAQENSDYALLSCAYACFGNELFEESIWSRLQLNSESMSFIKTAFSTAIECTSMGRLFDAVSRLLNLCGKTNFEGQAAMALEFAAEKSDLTHFKIYGSIPISKKNENKIMQIDWRPLFKRLFYAYINGENKSNLAAQFHWELADAMLRLANQFSVKSIGLTGGCFQNRRLSSALFSLLPAGITCVWSTQVPINDGGISVGQWWASTNLS